MDPIRETALPNYSLELTLMGVGEHVQAPDAPFVRFNDYEDDYEDDFEEEDDFDSLSDEDDDFDDEDDGFGDEDDDFEDEDDDFEEGGDDYDYEDDIDYNDFDE